MSSRAESTVQAVAVPFTLQLLLLVALMATALAVAALSGATVASLQQVSSLLSTNRLSNAPLTEDALIAELDPSLVARRRPAVAPAPAAQPAAGPAPDASPPAPPAAGGPGPPPAAFTARQAVLVSNAGSGCVNVRDTPGLTGQVLRCLAPATNLVILSGPTDADGYRWWNVDAGGWIAESFLAPAPAPAPVTSAAPAPALPSAAQPLGSGYAGWATYYGVEDGFVRGDIMYDGTPFDPANPTIAAASFLIPLHTWLLVCSAARCIVVEVRDRGLLDQNGILLDLSRGAYATLFGGLGGKQHVSALFIDPGIVALFPSLTAAGAP